MAHIVQRPQLFFPHTPLAQSAAGSGLPRFGRYCSLRAFANAMHFAALPVAHFGSAGQYQSLPTLKRPGRSDSVHKRTRSGKKAGALNSFFIQRQPIPVPTLPPAATQTVLSVPWYASVCAGCFHPLCPITAYFPRAISSFGAGIQLSARFAISEREYPASNRPSWAECPQLPPHQFASAGLIVCCPAAVSFPSGRWSGRTGWEMPGS